MTEIQGKSILVRVSRFQLARVRVIESRLQFDNYYYYYYTIIIIFLLLLQWCIVNEIAHSLPLIIYPPPFHPIPFFWGGNSKDGGHHRFIGCFDICLKDCLASYNDLQLCVCFGLKTRDKIEQKHVLYTFWNGLGVEGGKGIKKVNIFFILYFPLTFFQVLLFVYGFISIFYWKQLNKSFSP